MRVVALCDALGTAARLWRGLGRMQGVDLRILVLGGPFRRARTGTSADWRTAARLFLRSRLGFARGLGHRSTIARLRALRPEIGLYACGAICPKPVLDCFPRGLLNQHLGLLPESRGRAAMEWAIFEGRPTGVTVFFLDPGIGTGKDIVVRRAVSVGRQPDLRAARRSLEERDAEFFREALERLQNSAYRPIANDGHGRRFYAMSRLFEGIVDEALRRPAISRASGACT